MCWDYLSSCWWAPSTWFYAYTLVSTLQTMLPTKSFLCSWGTFSSIWTIMFLWSSTLERRWPGAATSTSPACWQQASLPSISSPQLRDLLIFPQLSQECWTDPALFSTSMIFMTFGTFWEVLVFSSLSCFFLILMKMSSTKEETDSLSFKS